MQLCNRTLRQGCIQKDLVAMSGDTKRCRQPAAARLPRDVIASILVRLPGSDLRRLRRVCKEWRDIIADPTFIQEHLIHGSRAPPTHTIVFFPGFTYNCYEDPSNAHGFLFDEHRRLTAEFTAGPRVAMESTGKTRSSRASI